MNRAFRVGHNCQAWCTKCKSETEHVIVAMVDAIPKRVECCGCSTQHNYRLPPGTGKAAAPRKKTATRTRKPRARNWLVQVAEAQGLRRSYAISASFQEGDFLEHPRFGPGIVSKVVPGGKIEVLFEKGLSLLVHER